MAITKKHQDIQAKKTETRRAIADVAVAIRSACNRVPKKVMDGSAQLAVAWRSKAEESIKMSEFMGGSLSLGDLQEAHAVRVKLLNWLIEPVL